jgi:nitrite reductase/ring-hydroxylating ferredoxin subunit
MFSIKILPTLFLFFFLFTTCKKERQGVPYVPVDLYLYTTSPEFSNLNAVGGWTYINGGSRGIVIYHRSNDEFVAFDRHCTYQVEDPCGQVSVDASYIALRDSCCGSEFLLYDGSVTKGPATLPLQAYYTEYDGMRLRIYN